MHRRRITKKPGPIKTRPDTRPSRSGQKSQINVTEGQTDRPRDRFKSHGCDQNRKRRGKWSRRKKRGCCAKWVMFKEKAVVVFHKAGKKIVFCYSFSPFLSQTKINSQTFFKEAAEMTFSIAKQRSRDVVPKSKLSCFFFRLCLHESIFFLSRSRLRFVYKIRRFFFKETNPLPAVNRQDKERESRILANRNGGNKQAW